MKISKRTNKIPTPSKRGRKKIDRSKCAYQNVVKALTTILNSSTVKKHNKRLLSDAVAVSIKAASTRSSIHGARKRMKMGKSRRQIARVLEGLDLGTVEEKTNSILRADAKRRFGGQVIDSAIDIHLIPYYGGPHERKEEIGRSVQKEGTTKFHMMATAYVIGKGRKRFTLAVKFVPLGTTMRQTVQELLYLLRRCGVAIDILLLDRGFYSIDVVKLLMRLNIGFIIPMRGNRLEKKRGSYRTTYVMKSAKDGKPISQLVGAVSVIKYNRGKRFKEHRAMQLCFIIHRIDISLHRISEFYRKRFGIESSYKLNKAIRPRTSSRNPAIRLFLFGVALIIQNIWVGIKLIFCKRIRKDSELMITQYDFAGILVYWVRRYYGEKKNMG